MMITMTMMLELRMTSESKRRGQITFKTTQDQMKFHVIVQYEWRQNGAELECIFHKREDGEVEGNVEQLCRVVCGRMRTPETDREIII